MNWQFNLETWLYGLVSALAGAVVLLIRKIYTNEGQLKLLKAEIQAREEFNRQRDEQIKEQLKELRDDVKVLMRGIDLK